MYKAPKDILSKHPCYGAKKGVYGRIHLPVAPKCNIQCAYCERKFHCVNQSRPGITDKVMSPDEAIEYIRMHDTSDNNLQVLGIAGPGESLFNEETFEVLELIKQYYPEKITCLSTNGMLLEEKRNKLLECGVNCITVTLNTLRVDTARKIYINNPKDYIEELLIKQQMGIEKITRSNILVKLNFVYIPGINDKEVKEVAEFGKRNNVSIMNIMPLIPLGKYKNIQPPLKNEIVSAQREVENTIRQLKGCEQCRADAVGIPSCGFTPD